MLAASLALISGGERPKCLFANTRMEAVDAGDCGRDRLRLGSDPTVSAAMSAFGLAQGQVAFVACGGEIFSAGLEDGSPGHIRIAYPDKAPRASGEYVAALVHELGHARQLRDAGSMEALQDRYTSCGYLELEADFLAGVVFRRNFSRIDPGEFERNLQLIGAYEEDCPSHGTPETRIAAFRLGFYLPRPPVDLATARSDFEARHYRYILGMARS